jgi:bifunctional enzyme CysN/CysC
MVRELTAPAAFLEVYVDTPLEECMRRDPKGLYAKARAGRLEHFTGLDSPYEPPEASEIRVTTIGVAADAAAEQILEALRARKII